jgi:nondiscriminating glutamyl-tRNA synthetase
MRTRFAPSPTGSLHVGNARIAVLNWLVTRGRNGAFVLRIEDTDVERNLPGAEAGILRDLQWLGLDWDEGPEHGPHAPYRQSERGASYHRYADRLLEAGVAYFCFCPDVVGRDDAQGQRRDRCDCASLDPDDARQRAAAAAKVLRFRVPRTDTIAFSDAARGDIAVAGAEIADFVILRADGRPTYNFAVVVDDIEMRITHVIRGVGHLSNTPRQVLLYRALEVDPPAFVHVPMVLGPDRQKLSKRHGATGMGEYRAAGYHPDAVVNYLSLLSWSSPTGDEVLSREELIEQVSLHRIGVADVVFDPVKLRWLSGKHIEFMPLPDLVAAVRPHLDTRRFPLDDERLAAAVAAARTHLATFGDINEQLEPFFPSAEHSSGTAADAGRTGSADSDSAVLMAARRTLEALPEWSDAALREAIQRVGGDVGARGRALYQPLRHALTGREHGPPLSAVLVVQGREPALQRLASASRDVQPPAT